MSIERVREYFRQYQMEDRIQEFDVSSATVSWRQRRWAVSLPELRRPCPLRWETRLC